MPILVAIHRAVALVVALVVAGVWFWRRRGAKRVALAAPPASDQDASPGVTRSA
jgi:heme A synthase